MEIEISPAPVTPDAGGTGQQKPAVETKKPDNGISDGETKEERKFRLKYGKEERDVTEKELIAGAQKGWAADQRFKEAAAMKREVQDALANGDVEYLLKKMKGKGQLDWARDVIKSELNRRSMSDEEREADDNKNEIRRLKEERMQLESQKTEAKRAEQQRFYEDQYDRDLSQAIQKHGLPKNKYVVGRAVKIASEIVDMGLDPDWDLVVGEAKRQTQGEIQELFGQLDDYGILGDDIPRKISKWLVSKGMTRNQADKEAAKVVRNNGEQKAEQEPVDSNDWFANKRKQWESK